MKGLPRVLTMSYGMSQRVLSQVLAEKDMFFLDTALRRPSKDYESFLGIRPIDRLNFNIHGVWPKKLPSYPMIGTIDYQGQLQWDVYDAYIVFDHRRKKAFLHAATQSKAAAFFKEQWAWLNQKRDSQQCPRLGLSLLSSMTKAEYVRAVKKILKHIYDGDIYQCNMTYALKGQLSAKPGTEHILALYGALRRLSPTNLSAVWKSNGLTVLSLSPERFLRLEGDDILLSPMKGTRPRSAHQHTDARFKDELIKSRKEQAELLMVTDLARHDLGQICRVGSVKVKTLRRIEAFKNVYQASSIVSGRLHPACGLKEIWQAVFPSGSVTGCPKQRAMEIIEANEKKSRGLYTGVLGHWGLMGRSDFNVLIRSLVLNEREIVFNVGSGIVADSNPQAEYDETLLKAKSLTQALHEVFAVQIKR